jgi:MerR family transcriptional regulator, light-induced transcriptional regulator
VNTSNPEKRHPIQLVSRRTGLSPDVLRAWEKRYYAVSPTRTSTNRRLYSDIDVERLVLLRRAIIAGRTIGQIARLSDSELHSLVMDDEANTDAPPLRSRESAGPTVAEPYFSACITAVRAFDARALKNALSHAAVGLNPPALFEKLLIPLIQTVGDLWRTGGLRVAHEHMASAIARTIVGNMMLSAATRFASRIVVATPAGQHHEFGALIAAAVAMLENWDVVYLGPDLPAEDIAAAARLTGAEAVALSIVYPAADVTLCEELYRLRDELSDQVVIIAGGRSVATYSAVLCEIRALTLNGMDELRRELQARRQR